MNDDFSETDAETMQELSSFLVGEKYLIQTNTLWFWTGECVADTKDYVIFKNVAWVQEMGRLSVFANNSGGVAQFAEHCGNRTLRVRKDAIVVDMLIDNLIVETLPSR